MSPYGLATLPLAGCCRPLAGCEAAELSYAVMIGAECSTGSAVVPAWWLDPERRRAFALYAGMVRRVGYCRTGGRREY